MVWPSNGWCASFSATQGSDGARSRRLLDQGHVRVHGVIWKGEKYDTNWYTQNNVNWPINWCLRSTSMTTCPQRRPWKVGLSNFGWKLERQNAKGPSSFFCIQLVDCSQTLGYKSWTKTYTYSHLMSFIVIFTHQPSCFQGFNHFAPNTFRKPPGKSGSFVMT